MALSLSTLNSHFHFLPLSAMIRIVLRQFSFNPNTFTPNIGKHPVDSLNHRHRKKFGYIINKTQEKLLAPLHEASAILRYPLSYYIEISSCNEVTVQYSILQDAFQLVVCKLASVLTCYLNFVSHTYPSHYCLSIHNHYPHPETLWSFPRL
jgi:hypothetical protein